MRIRYCLWFTYITLIHLFCWYYVICFCAVYPSNSYPWFYGSIISLLLEFLILSTILHFILSILRHIAKRKKTNKYAINMYVYFRKIYSYI